jgi:dTDP-4-dehydrorhamnose reductase
MGTEKKHVLVLGSGGMLGHVVAKYLNEKEHLVHCVGRRSVEGLQYKNIDVSNFEALKSFISDLEPDFVINCIGALIKTSENTPSSAIYLNALFPHLLSKLGSDLDFKLIHISTDCVFSGRNGPYSVADFRDGDDIYARSKALGEIEDDRNCTLRTSIIGPELKEGGEGLFDWFLGSENAVNGFTRVYWSGVTTLELAKSIEIVLENQLTGVHHVTNNTPIAKYELLKIIKDVFGKNIELIPKSIPSYNKCIIYDKQEIFNIPSYLQMVRNLQQFMKNNNGEYEKYFA